MLALIAAIIAGKKERSGWAVFFWIVTALHLLAAIGEESVQNFLVSGLLWLIIALCLKKKEPEKPTVVVNNYVSGEGVSQHTDYSPNYQEAEYREVAVNPVPSPVTVKEPKIIPAELPTVRTPKSCSECGAPLNGNSKFCTYCGTKIE